MHSTLSGRRLSGDKMVARAAATLIATMKNLAFRPAPHARRTAFSPWIDITAYTPSSAVANPVNVDYDDFTIV